MSNLTDKDYKELETLVKNILEVLALGRAYNGDSVTNVYGLSIYIPQKKKQLDQIDNLIDEFLSPNIGWNKNERSIY